MKKKYIFVLLCIVVIFSLTACSASAEAVEPATANAVINGGGNASMGQDADGNSIIENLADGDYAEWIIEISTEAEYNINIEYGSESEEFACTAELYSETGKLQSETPLKLSGTGSLTTFNTMTETVGKLEKGAYTFILRPANEESKSINIKSVKFTP